MDFYVVLPSNGSGTYFPANTTSCYTNHIKEALVLDGAWEVALVEIEYPISWTVLKQDIIVSLVYRIDTSEGARPLWNDDHAEVDLVYGQRLYHGIMDDLRAVHAKIPAGYYRSAWQIANMMRDRFVSEEPKYLGPHLQVERAEESGMIKFKSKSRDMEVVIYKGHDEIAQLLGFASQNGTKTLKKYPVDRPGLKRDGQKKELACSQDIPRILHTNSIQVHTEIVEEEQVGDARLQILKIVQVKGESGKTSNKCFRHPHYKPVSKHYINSISIELKDDSGQRLNFTSGKVICILHFRKCGSAV